MKRSSFVKASLLSVAIPSLGFSNELVTRKKNPLRFAHLTDIHVKSGIVPETGMTKALHQVQQSKVKVDFIINGGDAIWDALEADKASTRAQFDIFNSILKNNNSLPIHHCIGNHDIWGWFSKTDGLNSDNQYGKQWIVDEFQMPKRYYSFQKSKWHFIVLDSTQLNPAGGYIAKIDEEQLEWLKQTLQNIPKENYICIVSHIPILSICAGLFFEKTESNGDRLFKRNLMHIDAIDLKKLFIEYPNIKVCISGHIHLQDELEYLGVKYYCNGAVCGGWWKGKFQEFAPAYAVMELHDDGTSSRTMYTY
ncbi:metallophosphoesterase family protein [Solitalea lacus]|uniref:metallophosphoesterase family protein n=1 Tax=Solitalea lacus TaxID=2911172 RepID=UPI001EDA778F|nr:metallophosphoesterase [Solitalea lacus]UKJ06660.1 metallophosphoesterase [Solitalea lacus]